MKPASAALAERIRRDFVDLVELDKHDPDDVEAILRSTIAHIRSWKPTVLQVPADPQVADAAR